jgi:hypothetical protein
MKHEWKAVAASTLCVPVVLAALAGAASAQELPRVEVFVGYSNLLHERVTSNDVSTVNGLTPAQVRTILGADITSNRGRAGLNGLQTSVTTYVTERIGLTGDVSANLNTEAATYFGLPGSSKVRAYQFLGGPQIRFTNRTRAIPFARALFGVTRQTGTYRNPVATLVDRNTAFAMAAGGGLDVRVARRIDVRVVQIDYNSVSLPDRDIRDSTGVPFALKDARTHNVRMSFGVVLK